jgi:hypothetical protein
MKPEMPVTRTRPAMPDHARPLAMALLRGGDEHLLAGDERPAEQRLRRERLGGLVGAEFADIAAHVGVDGGEEAHDPVGHLEARDLCGALGQGGAEDVGRLQQRVGAIAHVGSDGRRPAGVSMALT